MRKPAEIAFEMAQSMENGCGCFRRVVSKTISLYNVMSGLGTHSCTRFFVTTVFCFFVCCFVIIDLIVSVLRDLYESRDVFIDGSRVCVLFLFLSFILFFALYSLLKFLLILVPTFVL